MGCFVGLLTQRGALQHAKPVLFVRYGETQPGHGDPLLDQRLGAYENVQVPIGGHPREFPLAGGLGAAGYQTGRHGPR